MSGSGAANGAISRASACRVSGVGPSSMAFLIFLTAALGRRFRLTSPRSLNSFQSRSNRPVLYPPCFPAVGQLEDFPRYSVRGLKALPDPHHHIDRHRGSGYRFGADLYYPSPIAGGGPANRRRCRAPPRNGSVGIVNCRLVCCIGY